MKKGIIVGLIIFSVFLTVGFSLWQGGKLLGQPQTIVEAAGITSSPEHYDLNEVPLNAGIVTKEYEIKNTTSEAVELKRIFTSCMCTEAKVKIGEKETRFFGMEFPGDRNPPLNMGLSPGETAKVTVNFDPASHGPSGTGPFERSVWLLFANPESVKELTFKGIVV